MYKAKGEVYSLGISKTSRKGEKKDADLDHLQNPTTFLSNTSCNPPSQQIPSQKVTTTIPAVFQGLGLVINQIIYRQGLNLISPFPFVLLPVLAPSTSIVLLPMTGLHPSFPLVHGLLPFFRLSSFEEQLAVKRRGRRDME